MIATLFFAGNAIGACDSRQCTGTIKRLYMDATNIYVQLDGDVKKLGCSLHGGKYIGAPLVHPAFGAWHAMLLGAFRDRSAVTVRKQDGAAGCLIAYVVMDR